MIDVNIRMMDETPVEVVDSDEVLTTKKPKNRKIFKILIDVVQLMFFSAPVIIYLIMYRLMKIQHKGGFFCDDNSIKYPYIVSSISQLNLGLHTLFGPIIMLIATEIFTRTIKNRKIYRRLRNFLYGYFLCCSIVFIPKFFDGNLRPHFLDMCKPDIDCTDKRNQFIFHTNYICTNGYHDDIYISFPSVHASVSTFVAMYLIIYTHNLVKWKRLRLSNQFLLVIYAFSVSTSRVYEYHHHPIDVFVGIGVGIMTAIVSTKYLDSFFQNGRQQFIT